MSIKSNFTIYLSHLEETMENWQVGGIKVGDKKVWSLSYADDCPFGQNHEINEGYNEKIWHT